MAKSPKRPAPRGTASYPRKRAVTACQVCRARRTKCDNLKPTCSFCLKTGAVCIQSPIDLSSFDPASLRILERLDVVENLMRSIQNRPSPLSSVGSSQSAQVASPPASVSALAQPSSILPERLDDVLAWSVFEAADIYTHTGPDVKHAGDTSTAFPHTPAALGALLDDVPVNKLAEAFFSYVHVKNPILDEAATRRLLSSININGVDWSQESCLYLLICALGFLATPFGPSESTLPGSTAYANALAFFNAAEKRLGPSIGSGDLVAAQCLFLSGVYMMTIFQPKKAWRFFVQSVAACQDLPFLSNSDPSGGDTFYNKAVCRGYTLQQAVYWSAWKSEREIRAQLHLPDFSLADKDRGFYPSFFPTPPVQQEIPSESTSSDAKHEATAWYYYLAEISLRRLSSRVCADLLALAQTGDFLASAALAVPAWETEAQQWVDSLPPPLSLNSPTQEDDICKFILRGHLINLYELIYWPFVCAMLGIGAAAASLKHEFRTNPQPDVVVQMAEKGLRTCIQRIEINKPGFKHRHHGTWPMIRTCTRSALILAASAMILHDRYDVNAKIEPPSTWNESLCCVINLLMYWEAEVPGLAKARRVLEESIQRMRIRNMQ